MIKGDECMNENNKMIEFHCRKCNKFIGHYILTGNDEKIVLDGFGMQCARCKRVIIFKKYTEGMLRIHAQQKVIKL